MDDGINHVIIYLALISAQAAEFTLAVEQVTLGDLVFFFRGVALQRDDFHAVAQRSGNGIDNIGGGDEQHL